MGIALRHSVKDTENLIRRITMVGAIFFALVLWLCSGFKKIPVGKGSLVLFFGKRTKVEMKEGWVFVPAPWSLMENLVDLRQQVTKLDPLKVLTSDQLVLNAEGSIVWEVVSMREYSNLKPGDLKIGFDDMWDKRLRGKIGVTPMAEAVHMQLDLSDLMMKSINSEPHWGIRAKQVNIAALLPANKETEADLELQAREGLQRNGQVVEATHVVTLINLFEKNKDEGGAGMSHASAVEMAQLITGKAGPKNLTGFSFSPEVIQAATNILGRK